MTHVGELLSGYLDGELTADEEQTVLDHLDECTICRHELVEVETARAALRSLPVVEPPVPLDIPSLASRTRRRLTRRVGLAAAAAAAIVLAVGVVRGGPTEEPIDLGSVVDQHTARVSADPGLSPARGVSLVFRP